MNILTTKLRELNNEWHQDGQTANIPEEWTKITSDQGQLQKRSTQNTEKFEKLKIMHSYLLYCTSSLWRNMIIIIFMTYCLWIYLLMLPTVIVDNSVLPCEAQIKYSGQKFEGHSFIAKQISRNVVKTGLNSGCLGGSVG